MEQRNLDKVIPFVESYKRGEIIYKDGALYKTVKRFGSFKKVELENPKLMRFNSDRGYWRVSICGVTCYEHIVIYAILNGIDSLKNFECIDHIDTNKKNNKIENLEGVTIEENNLRAKEKGLLKDQSGSNNNASTISDKTVNEIRELWAKKIYTQREIANIFGVGQATVSHIVNYKRRG